MSKGWVYKSGDWNLVCDVCSKKIKASTSRKRWDGYQVCSDCWEPRHSLDFIRARMDKISVPFTRPQPTDTFVPTACTIFTRQGRASYGTADCAGADYNPGEIGYCVTFVDYNGEDSRVGVALVGYAVVGEEEDQITYCFATPQEAEAFKASYWNAVADYAIASHAVADVTNQY
jgi:hypothetical protein